MSKRDAFLIRLDEKILSAIRRWADDDLRSVNGQIEFLLRKALIQSGRLPKPSSEDDTEAAKE